MTTLIGALLVAVAVVIFVLQPVVKGIQASMGRTDDELTDTEARKRVALLALRDVEYDYLAGKLDDADYRSLKAELTAEALAALRADEEARARVSGTAFPGDEELEAEIARVREGLRAGVVCVVCGFENETGSRFCSSCGQKLGPPATNTARQHA